jgi:AcrR family transcriptional regulator
MSTKAGPAEATQQDARRTDTRERILDVATRLFSEQGFAATSTQAIADELGVTKAALYYHFESKHEILMALKEPILEALEEVLAAPSDCTTAVGRREFITRMVDTLVVRGGTVASLMTDSRATFEMRSAVEESGLPQVAAGMLIAGLAGVDDPAKAPPEVLMRVSATIGALHGAFDGWVQMHPGASDMHPSTRRLIVDAAVAVLESGS